MNVCLKQKNPDNNKTFLENTYFTLLKLTPLYIPLNSGLAGWTNVFKIVYTPLNVRIVRMPNRMHIQVFFFN